MKLAGLAALVGAMTDGPWEKTYGSSAWFNGIRGIYSVPVDSKTFQRTADGNGIIALRNHAEKLLAVCEAAEAVASLGWGTSVTEIQHTERLAKMVNLRAKLRDLEGA